MNLIKSATANKELELYNLEAMQGFMKYVIDNGCKVLFCAAVDTENRIQITMVPGITLEQTKDLIQQMAKEFERLKKSTD